MSDRRAAARCAARRRVAAPALGACLALLAGCRPDAAPSPSATVVDRAALAAEVRAEIAHAWAGYERHAWGHDELRPVSETAHDWHAASLLITPVDSLDTLLMAGLDAEAERARALVVERLSFDHDVEVKNFEIVIRVLGGLLSGHQLTGDPRLLELAEDLGRRLLPVFDSPTGMPYMYVHLATGATRGARTNPAEIGTLILELGTLSRLTGDPVFFERAKGALVALHERRSPLGLVGEEIDVETGEWTGTASHVGGGIDSYYEYLLKCSLLFDDADCGRMWREAEQALWRLAEETGQTPGSQSPGGLWLGQVDMATGERTASEFGALHAFLPAVLVLGGDVERAARLQASAHAMWTLHGIEPEVLDYRRMEVVHPRYPLRPEIMESAWSLWRATGDPRYLEMGRTYFAALRERCRTAAGYTVLDDVTTGARGDLMPSYFLAETLKYLYLLFAPDEAGDLDGGVFTTEAHPLRPTWRAP